MNYAKPVLTVAAFLASVVLAQVAPAQLCHAGPAVQGASCNCGTCSSGWQTEEILCGCGECKPGCFDKCPRPKRRLLDRCGCPDCGHCFNVPSEWCEFNATESTEERTCFKTEQKTVCIPPITFPWQKCGPVKSAKTRSVTVLTTHKYKCPVCKYSWDVKKADIVWPAGPVAPPAVNPPAGIVVATPVLPTGINE